MADLSRIGDRERLKSRKGDEPHWHRLRSGSYVGYRPSKRGGRGTWFARAYNTDTGKYSRKALGSYAHVLGHEVFVQAKSDAEIWADQVESGGVLTQKVVTVADACRAYAEEKPNAEGNLKRTVYADPVSKIRLDKLRRHHLRDWRKRLEERPALISRSKLGEKRTKARSKSTVNRDLVPLRAALGRFLSPGTPNTDACWQEALRPHKGVDRRRDLYLDRADRLRLLAACDAEAAPFIRAMCQLPLRPGALAKLSAADFDRRNRVLTVGEDKHGRPRQVTVPDVLADFLGQQSKGKLPHEPLFARTNGKRWDKDAWKVPVKEAVRAANLPDAVSAYSLRHCVLTDLVRSGLPILTVAQLAGTSVAMIERHYAHLVRDDAEAALRRLAL